MNRLCGASRIVLKRAQSLNLCCLLIAGLLTILPTGIQEANASPGGKPAYLIDSTFESIKPGRHKFEVKGHGVEISIPENFSFKQDKGERTLTILLVGVIRDSGPAPQYSNIMRLAKPDEAVLSLTQFCEMMKKLTGKSMKNYVPGISESLTINGIAYEGFHYSGQVGERLVKGFTMVTINNKVMYAIGRLDKAQYFQEDDAVFNGLVKSYKYF
ncbi:MAG: hypothetical protein K2X81_09725 [Candidatus Obscuribacterales bacterium]|nr:hypothetical protein [Candidatus Obscuribacterales bacterium]